MESKKEKKQYGKDYYLTNKEKILESNKKWRLNNKEKHKRLQKEWNLNNKEYIKKYQDENKEKIRDSRLKYYFNITLDQYNELLIKQNGVCAICLKSETILDKRTNSVRQLCVDHDHKTGKVRGLLCNKCNKAIGLLYDDLNLLNRAIKYLAGE